MWEIWKVEDLSDDNHGEEESGKVERIHSLDPVRTIPCPKAQI